MDTLLIIAIVVAIVAVIIAITVCLIVRRNRRQREVFIKFKTMAGPLRIYTIAHDEDWIRVMDVQGTMQSATYLDDWRCYDLVYEYTKFYDRMFDAAMPIDDVLILGGGGYSYPKHLISHYPKTRCDVVEIDPMVTSIAQRYFFLDRLMIEFNTEENDRLKLICDEARNYLGHCEKQYSAIINDCFSGLHFEESLATLEAAQLYHSRLVENGVFLTNVIGALEGNRSHMMQRVIATLEEVFEHVYIIPGQPDMPTNCDNNVIIATDGPWSFTGAYPFVRDLDARILLDCNTINENWTVPVAD